MTLNEVFQIKKVLERIKEPDGHIKEAIAACDRQIAIYDARRGQMKDHYESDYRW